MEKANLINKFAQELSTYVTNLSIDCVIMGLINNELHVLVLRWKETKAWGLPGGFIKKNEGVDDAARRILKRRTNLDITYLKQLHVFGNNNRRDIPELTKELKGIGATKEIIQWFEQRFVSISYLALVNPETFEPIPDEMSDLCEWKPINALPDLIFDHKQMVQLARGYIKTQLKYQPIGLLLLPEKFTMKMLQNLYEVILDKKLDRGNFQKKILKLDILNRHQKQMTGGAHKAPYLYSFNTSTYNELLQEGIGFI